MAEFPDNNILNRPPETIVSKLSLSIFGAHTYRRQESVIANINQSILVKGNPNRVSMLLVNNSVGEVYVSFDPDVSSNRGFILGPNGGSISLNFRDDGELVGDTLYSSASDDNLYCTLIETLVQGYI